MSDIKVPKDQVGHFLSWMVAAALARWAVAIFLIWDVIARWGGPLILQATWQTIVWVAAAFFVRFAMWRLKRSSEQVVRAARDSEQ